MLLAVTVDRPTVVVAVAGVTFAPFNSKGEPATREVIAILVVLEPSKLTLIFFKESFAEIAVLIAAISLVVKSDAVVLAAPAEVIVTPLITTVAVSAAVTVPPIDIRET
jgi:hypothetical protein